MTGSEKRHESTSPERAEANGRPVQGARLHAWEPDEIVDTTSYDSFPASDPPGWEPFQIGARRLRETKE